MFLPVLAPAAALSHGLGGDTDAMRVRCRLSYNSTRIGGLRDLSSNKSLWPQSSLAMDRGFENGGVVNEYDDNGLFAVEMDSGGRRPVLARRGVETISSSVIGGR
jgi:hypothetical protein